ncbi:sialin-like isoform X2 [Symsagittifera roscoffensis]|uniref:sialin-like isoform X2 n=1 Tax=Symsagittifera roscoffensis TaxID=84072 RepID=UPI00307BC154
MTTVSKEVKILIAFCAVANFINTADRVLLPICMVQMSKQYDWNLGFQGWVLSGFGFGYISSQVLGGSLSIRLGGKRVLTFAVFVWSLATFLTPFFAHFDVVMIITRVGLGLAEGLALPAIFQIFSENVHKEERAKAFSYLVSGGSVGQVVASVVCPQMVWQASFISFGGLGFLWGLLWLLFISRCNSATHKLPEYSYVAPKVLGGSLSIRLGGKRVLTFAVFVWSLATFLTPFFAHFDVVMIITRVGLGLAEGLALPAIFQIFSENVHKEERAKAFSYLVSGGSVGQVVASVVCPQMVWQASFISFGGLGFLWGLLWLLFISRCNSATHKLPEYSYVAPKSSVHWSEFVNHSSLLAIYFAHLCMNCSNYTVMSWLPTYLDRVFKAKPDEMSLTAFPYAANSILGVVAGHYADYLIVKRSWTTLSVRRAMTTVGLVGPALFTLLFSLSDNVALALLFISVSMGLCACNSSGHLSNHVEVAPTQASLTFAVSNTLASIPGITAGPVTATIVEYTGQWKTVFLITSLINLAGASVYMSYSATSQVI